MCSSAQQLHKLCSRWHKVLSFLSLCVENICSISAAAFKTGNVFQNVSLDHFTEDCCLSNCPQMGILKSKTVLSQRVCYHFGRNKTKWIQDQEGVNLRVILPNR